MAAGYGATALDVYLQHLDLSARGAKRFFQQLRLVDRGSRAQFNSLVRSLSIPINEDTVPEDIYRSISNVVADQRSTADGAKYLERITFEVQRQRGRNFLESLSDVSPAHVEACWHAMLGGLGDAGKSIRTIIVIGAPCQLLPGMAAAANAVCKDAHIRLKGTLLETQADLDVAAPFLTRLVFLSPWSDYRLDEYFYGNQVCSASAPVLLPDNAPQISRISVDGHSSIILGLARSELPCLNRLELRGIPELPDTSFPLERLQSLQVLRVEVWRPADIGVWQLTRLPRSLKRLEVAVGGLCEEVAVLGNGDRGVLRRRDLLGMLARCTERMVSVGDAPKLWAKELTRGRELAALQGHE